ncbi:hypothetical protein HYU16_03265 [Candidatus Woesearchaeota archaeon]|nr:hypothetical protein [Candidatus Woesearchaeota archaeon]
MASAVVASGKAKKAAAQLFEPERCARCGTPVVETHCRVLCTNCGFTATTNGEFE